MQWVIENAEVTELKDVARLRLARILNAEGDLDAAIANLNGIEADSFRPAIDELKGDIALAGDDRRKAVEAYRQALRADDLDASSRQRVKIKLSDLGVAPSAR